MAVCWKIYKLNCCLHVVVWLILVSLNGAQSNEPSFNIQNSAKSKPHSLTNTRFEREADDTSFPPQSSENEEENVSSDLNPEDIPTADYNENTDSIISPENIGDSQMEEEDEIKPKLTNKQLKYIPNYFKNYSKVIANDSFNEKQKPGMYGPQGLKYNNLSKKDSKFNTSNNELKVNATNLAVPNSYMLGNVSVRPEPPALSAPGVSNVTVTDKLTNSTKPSEALMSDQPVDDLTQNITNTDSAEDDSEFTASQNTTGLFEENNGTTSADGRTMPPSEGLDFLLISGIILGTAVFLGLVAGGGFAVYRHRIWNKPQTLSDKCSNADSSGYIDDSTLRENSEEMYSLDNDSFLNSLEAMTIQNYWTDNVKHTKL